MVLCIASADRGHISSVEELIKARAEVNVVNILGSPLAYAAKNGNTLARILLSHGANASLVSDPLGATPLEIARNNKKEEMVELLAPHTGEATVPEDLRSRTSFPELLARGDEALILQSFREGEKDGYGRTVPITAPHSGKTELLEKMRALGTLDTPDAIGRPPLHYAIMKGHESTVHYLISEAGGAAIDSRDNQGYGPLMWACQYNRDTIAETLLQKAKAKKIEIVNLTDKFGWKPLHKVAQIGELSADDPPCDAI